MVFNGHAADPVVTRLVEEDKVRWWNKPNLRRLYLILFLCCMGVEMTSGFDSQLINTLQIAPAFLIYFGNGYRDSVGPNIEPAMLGFLGSCYQLGSVFAVPLAPYLNDRFGRRWTVMTGSIIMIVGALLQGFAQHIAMYVIARMLLGVGILFAIIAGSSLIGELSHPKERPTMTSFFNSTYFIGATVASAITLATVDIPNDWAWRVPSLLQIVPSLLQVTFIMFLPESPRWLVSKDRDDEAFAVLTKYHAEGDANSLLVQAEMAQIKSTIKLELEHAKQSWWDMIATPGMRRRFLIAVFLGLFTQMSGNTLLSSYGSLMMNQMGYTTTFAKTRITVAKNCWGFINANLIAIFVVKFPRRIAFMTSSTTMLLVFIGMTITFWALGDASAHKTTNSSAGVAALFFYFAYDPCYNIGNNSLTYTYLIELFPYAVRTRGISVEQFFGKLAGFFSTNVNPIALTAISWKFLAAYCGWIACEFFVQFFLYPETHGRTLEELAFLFEDDALNQQATAAVEKQIHSADAPLHQAATIEEAHAKA